MIPAKQTIVARPDFGEMAARYERAMTPGRYEWLSNDLGLPVESLRRLCVGWSNKWKVFSFPMACNCGIVGIRLRKPTGEKFAERGTDGNGIFVPLGLKSRPDRLLILEGPTDTAAAVALGFDAVGRPSCKGGEKYSLELVEGLQPREVVIVADNDGPGRIGADCLVVLLSTLAKIRTIRPPEGIKDMRKWYRLGVTRESVERLIDVAPIHQIGVSSRRRNGGRTR